MNDEREIYRAEQLPVFQNQMFASHAEAVACTRGDIVLVQNLRTGLLYNRSFHPELMDYGPEYQNEQAFSTVFRDHLDEVTNVIQHHFYGLSVIEIGCGKGHFLEHLQLLGFSITGLDPAYEGNSSQVIKAPFTPTLALTADGIILRHVLEHVPKPLDFLAAIRDANGGKGKIYLEVPCFDWICRQRAWFDIYYEHVNYFRCDDFLRMFGNIYETGHFFGGQYLYVVADLATLHPPEYCDESRVELPPDFLGGITHYAAILKAQKTKHGIRNQTAIWGGASKGVIFALYMQRAGAKVDFVVDINPAKQGKYLGATGLRVYSPEDVLSLLDIGSVIFVMNGNYLSEIQKLTDNKFNYLTVDHESI